jgi:hypothetical protein
LTSAVVAAIRRSWLVVGDPPGAVVTARSAVPFREAAEAARPVWRCRRPAVQITGAIILGPTRPGECQGNPAPQTRPQQCAHDKLLCEGNPRRVTVPHGP